MSSNPGARLDGRADGAQRTSSPEPARFYVPQLDVLRFFAFLSVFVFHVYLSFPSRPGPPAHPLLPRVFLAGAFGVDLFFVLSSYLITELLMRERAQTGTVDVRSFYARRILRIWPLYFSYLTLAFVLSNRLPGLFAVRTFYFAACFLLVGNFAMAIWGDAHSIIDQLWSISVEEQFYLIWPWGVRRLSTRGLALSAWGLIALAAASRLVSSILGVSGMSIWYDSLTRLDSIAVGILIATLPRHRRSALSSPVRAAMVLGGPRAGCLPRSAARC